MRYHIEASFEHDGLIIDCSQPEVVGDDSKFGSIDEAKEMADELQANLSDTDLAPSTVYSVYDGDREVYRAA